MSDILARIRSQQEHLTHRRSALADRINQLDAKLADLEVAARVVAEMTSEANVAMSSKSYVVHYSPVKSQDDASVTDAQEAPARGLQKMFIRSALSVDKGMTPSEIREKITEQHGVEVSLNTISVTLPRLRSEGQARLEGRQWFRVQDAETTVRFVGERPVVSHSSTKESSDAPLER